MPPPLDTPALNLHLSTNVYHLLRLPAASDVPEKLIPHLTKGHPDNSQLAFLSITRTPDEVSIVTDLTDPEVWAAGSETSSWGCIKVEGPLEHHLTGIMNALSLPLKHAGVPIFALSTSDTDYVLVPREKLAQAKLALSDDGWTIANPI